MKSGKKKESWRGIAITAVLCLGFLYWWLRPEVRPWEQENAGQLVARAMKEPRPSSRVEQQVIDLDLMEVAILQSGGKMLEEAVTTVKHIGDPLIKKCAVRQMAQTFLKSDPEDLGEAIGLADLLNDPAHRATVRTGILAQLAVLGFADAALPEAKSALQKATLAQRMAGTDDISQQKARELLAEVEKEVPALPAEEAAAVRREVAGARINLTVADGEDAAIAAIKILPPAEQPPFWKELAETAYGKSDDLRKLLPQINDAALRRRVEINSLLFPDKPWPAAEIVAKYRAEAEAAGEPAEKTVALMAFAAAQRNAEEPDREEAASASNATLRRALESAAAIPDAALRCASLLELSRHFKDAFPFQWDDAKSSLAGAAKSARAVQPATQRIQLLLAVSEETFNQADAPGANALITDALTDAAAAPPDAGTLQDLAAAVMQRSGDWYAGLALIDRIPDNAARLTALESVALAASEDSMAMDPDNPPPRGEPVDGIRRESAGDQVRAAGLVEKQPPGYARSRAWLAMAKGLIGPPSSLTDYMAGGGQAGEEPGGIDISGDEPGQETEEKSAE